MVGGVVRRPVAPVAPRRWAYTHMDEITTSRNDYDQRPVTSDAG